MGEYTVNKREWPLFNKYYTVLIIVSVISGLCNQFFNSTLSLHIDSVGMMAVNTGVLMGCFTLSATAARMVTGKLCDNSSRRKIIILGMSIFVVGSFMAGFSAAFWQLAACRLIQGIGFGISNTAQSAAVADVVPISRMGEGIGYYGLGTTISAAIGPTIALSLFAQGGFREVAAGGTIVLLVSMVLILTVRYENDEGFPGNRLGKINSNSEEIDDHDNNRSHSKKGIWSIFEKAAVPAAVINFFVCFAMGIVIAYLTLFAVRQGMANIGLFFTLSAVATALARLCTGRITDRLGPLFSLIPGFICGITAFVFLVLSASHHALFHMAGVFYGIFGGMTSPTLNAVAIKASPADRKGAASATFQTPMEFAFTVSSIAGGLLLDIFSSYELLFKIAAGFIIISCTLSIVLFRKRETDETVRYHAAADNQPEKKAVQI